MGDHLDPKLEVFGGADDGSVAMAFRIAFVAYADVAVKVAEDAVLDVSQNVVRSRSRDCFVQLAVRGRVRADHLSDFQTEQDVGETLVQQNLGTAVFAVGRESVRDRETVVAHA